MARLSDLKLKEVININDGCRYGFVCDVEFCIDSGEIEKIIVPGPAKVLGVFGRDEEYRIPWECIRQIGDDIILIDIDARKEKILCSCE